MTAVTGGLPEGEVTLLFTDVEGSTRLWELYPQRMPALLAEHDRILAAAVASAGGFLQLDRAEGDSGFAVFDEPVAAVRGAITLQRAMAAHAWPEGLRLRTRAALHTGMVEVRGDTYYGPVVNRCVKLRSLAHGGQTIASKATFDAVASSGRLDGATFNDLGTHRLKELAVPERVYELLHPELEAGFPPLRSPDVEQHNLPEIRGRFVGRSGQQREVTKALDVERLVTLTGTGGVGKTRLALEVAWSRVEDREHDGTWFADLTGARSPDDVDSILAAAVGVREQPGRPLLETITDQLGSRAALLVIDNCEHVVPAARRLARGVLQACPSARVLATSREALGLDGEHRRAVSGLPVDDAVELFFDRAGVERGAVDEAAVDAVERLCDRLDGIPFAIEIAAARAEAIGADAIEQGVALALGEETGRSVLEATLAWSHGLLDEDDQVLFRRVGIFAGPFALDAVESVAAFDPLDTFDVLDLLDGLVERSLVHRTDGGAYRQLVVARDYAQRLAESAGERDVLAARHLSWCTELVTALSTRGAGIDDRDRFDHARQVWDDLLIALDRDFAEDQASIQVQLAASMEGFWEVRGAYAEGRSRLEALLADGAGFRSHRAVAYRSAGRLAKWQGDLERARAHLDRSRALFHEILDELRATESPHVPVFETNLAGTLHEQSDVARIGGDPRTAVALAREAFSLSATPQSALILGIADQAAGDHDAADGLLSDALTAAVEMRDDRLAAECLRHLGLSARARGDLRGAEQRYGRALGIERGRGQSVDLAYTLLSLADLLVLRGEAAGDVLDEGLELARALGDQLAEAHGLSTLAEITADADPAAAAALHRAALDLRSRVGAAADEALSRMRVAAFDEVAGHLDEAAASSRQAAETFRQLGDHRGACEVLAQLARIEARRGQAAASREALRESVGSAGLADARIERADIFDAAAWLAFGDGRASDAAALVLAASELRAALGIVAPFTALAARQDLGQELSEAVPTAGRDPDALLTAVLEGL